MCSILGILDIKSNVADLRKQAIQLSMLLDAFRGANQLPAACPMR